MRALDIPAKLFGSLIAGFFLGMLIDNFIKAEAPIFTVIFAILGLISGVWASIKKTL